MYFTRNWEFGLALSKLRNFGGGGLNPLGTPLAVDCCNTTFSSYEIRGKYKFVLSDLTSVDLKLLWFRDNRAFLGGHTSSLSKPQTGSGVGVHLTS
jgi:hypothetical protein